MTIRDMGELNIIQGVKELFDNPAPLGVEGIGDDCAIIPYGKESSLLITTDLLIENTHFLRNKIHPSELGYKALAVNLSDIAAMGGQPLYAFLSIGLPGNISTQWLDQFFQGIKSIADPFNVLILGGDTSRAESIVINFTIIGSIKTTHIKKRSHAKEGDIICCTGFLGGSAAGLRLLLENLPSDSPIAKRLIQDHYRPYPHVAQGQWLSHYPGVHAMMDLSDGLASDIQRIMEQSHCGARIQLDALPLSEDLVNISELYGWPAKEMAAIGGEDYSLVLTIEEKAFESIAEAYQNQFGHPLHQIGRIVSEREGLIWLGSHNESIRLKHKGFEHFKK